MTSTIELSTEMQELKNAGSNTAALKEAIVKSGTAEQLNEMAAYIQQYMRPEVYQAVRETIKGQFNVLRNKVGVTAETMAKLVHPQEIVDTTKQAADAVTKPVKGWAASAFDTVNGWMGGGLAWVSNAFEGFQAPAWSKRALYYGCIHSKWIGLGFLPFGAQLEEFGKKKLAKLDMEEATGVEPYKGRFAFNPADDDPHWPAFMINLPTKGQTAKSAIVMYMDKVLKAAPPVPGTPEVVTLEKLQKFLNNPKDIDTEIAASASDKKKALVMEQPEWKALNVAKVEWSDTVTSFDRTTKTLTVSQADIGSDGKGTTGTNAERLMQIAGEMKSTNLVIVGSPKIVLEQRDGIKVASLPRTVRQSRLSNLDGILAKNWDGFQTINIDTYDRLRNKIQLKYSSDGKGGLNVPINDEMIVVLEQQIETLPMNQVSDIGGTWELKNSNLVPVGNPATPV